MSEKVAMADRSGISAVVNSVVNSIQKLPASIHSSTAASMSSSRSINRQKSVHQILGGGKTADVILWRDRNRTARFFAAISVAYFLFELSGYTLLSIVSNALLFSIVSLFLWANAASILNRPPPPIPKLQLSDDIVYQSAAILRVEMNKTLLLAYDVAIGKDFRVFLKVVIILWILPTIGGWFSFLTLLYIGFVAAFTLPVLYERYHDEIDRYFHILVKEAKKYYAKFEEHVINKIPRSAPKKKKAQ